MKPGSMGKNKKFLAAMPVFILALLAASFLLSAKRSNAGKDADKLPQEEKMQSGYTVTVSVDSQKMGGITTEVLKPALFQNKVAAYGQVLSAQGMGTSYKNYVSARSALEKAAALLKASRQEYARLKVLNASAKNISDRELQAAAARLASDEAEKSAALGALRAAKNAMVTDWGPVLSKWIMGYTASLKRVIEAKDVLVQLTLPAAASLKAIPQMVRIEPPSGGQVQARFVSRATSTAPSIQGMSFIYVAPSLSGGLVPGMNVTALMPSSGAQTGFFIPNSAVVWLQDNAWVYVKKSPTGFSRVETPTSMPVSGGYFVKGVFSAGDRIVIKGAQALLSEESMPKAAGGGDDD